MAAARFVLKDFLAARGIAAGRVVAETSPPLSRNTVYYLLRNEASLARIDFPTLAVIIAALRKLTGEEVTFNDLFEFDPDTPPLSSAKRPGGDGAKRKPVDPQGE